ncbi:MAG: FAD-dependent oxidoreductase [Eubacteriales bacterium]|nr:FAD-dependent oxidoreductase [Eubacteriales bacterium]
MKTWKSLCGMLLSLCLLLSCTAGLAEGAAYTAGTYTATAEGRNGAVTVEVAFSASAIESVTVTEQAETAGIADGALERIPAAIVDAQSLNVDAVSGATITSDALLTAVADCVAQAGGDVEALKQAPGAVYEKKLTDGAYTGTAHGHHSDVTVNVTVKDNAITAVEIGEQGESVNIADVAYERIPAAIVASQSIGVDAVSGATYTSQAILNAVADCLTQAGGENAVAAFSAKVPAEAWSQDEITEDYDVVVVGSGLSGIAAALSAQEGGANVLLLEKLPYVGGISQTAAGGLVYPGEEGTAAETFAERLLNRNVGNQQGWMNTPNAIVSSACVKALSENAYDALKWMESMDVGMMFMDGRPTTHYTLMNEDGSLTPTVAQLGCAIWTEQSAAAPNVGGLVLTKLAKRFTDNGGAIHLETPAKSLITDESGAVVGVKAEGVNGKYTINAKAVILCAGGFGASAEMVAEYAPAYIGEVNTTLVGNVGDGITMGKEIGAAVYQDAYMMGGSAQTIVTDADMIAPYSDHETPMTALYVNPQGVRVNSENPEPYSNSILHVNPDSRDYYWIIINQDVASQSDYINILTDELAKGNERFFTADNLFDLAKQIGMVPNTLINTMDNYNRLCAAGEDTDLFKGSDYMVAMQDGPWYAVKAYMQYFGTVGGLVTDENAAVLNEAGAVIPGLYAAGENSNHGVFARCYSGGISLTEAWTFGRIAGAQAASLLK